MEDVNLEDSRDEFDNNKTKDDPNEQFKPIDPLTVLKNVNNTHHNRPTQMKKKEAKGKEKRKIMRQIVAIFNKKGDKSALTPEMAAFRITRWAKRRLEYM